MAAWWNPLGKSKKADKPKKKAAPKAKRKAAPRAKREAASKARRKAAPKAKREATHGARKRKAAAGRKPEAAPGREGRVKKAAKAKARRKPPARERVQLRWIAQARSGDKGDLANIALFAPTEEIYEVFRREVTAERVKAHFKDFVKGRIDRYEVPNVRALNFVAHAALGGGGASSLRSDPLGKSYGSNLLRMEIDVPADVLARTPKWRPPKTLPDV